MKRTCCRRCQSKNDKNKEANVDYGSAQSSQHPNVKEVQHSSKSDLTSTLQGTTNAKKDTDKKL